MKTTIQKLVFSSLGISQVFAILSEESTQNQSGSNIDSQSEGKCGDEFSQWLEFGKAKFGDRKKLFGTLTKQVQDLFTQNCHLTQENKSLQQQIEDLQIENERSQNIQIT